MGSNNRSRDTKTFGFEMRFENNYGMYSHVFRLDVYLLIRSDIPLGWQFDIGDESVNVNVYN